MRLRLEGGSGRALNSSFETPLAAAPQDEGDESERGMAGTDPRIVSGTAMARENVERYATALITLVSFSTISPICSSLMMSGGESAMVSPVTRIIRPNSLKARSMAS